MSFVTLTHFTYHENEFLCLKLLLYFSFFLCLFFYFWMLHFHDNHTLTKLSTTTSLFKELYACLVLTLSTLVYFLIYLGSNTPFLQDTHPFYRWLGEIFHFPPLFLSQWPHLSVSNLIKPVAQFICLCAPLTFLQMQDFNILFKLAILQISATNDFNLYPLSILRLASWIKFILSFFRAFSVLRWLNLVIFLSPKWSRILPRSTQPTYNSVTINPFSILCRSALKRLTTTIL